VPSFFLLGTPGVRRGFRQGSQFRGGCAERARAGVRGRRRDTSKPPRVPRLLFLKELRACFRERPVQQLKLFQAFFGQLDAITDVYRRKHVEAKYRAPSIPNEKTAIELEDEAVLCTCFKELIPTLKYQELTIRNWKTTNKILALMDARTGLI